MKAHKIANALLGYAGSPAGAGTPGTNAVMPAPSASAIPPPAAPSMKPMSMPSAPKAAPAPPIKIGHELGSLLAIKQAMRMGSTAPTGYKFNLQDDWLKSLNPEAQTQAQAKAKDLNEWLAKNTEVGSAYGQHPEFARTMIALAQLAKKRSTGSQP